MSVFEQRQVASAFGAVLGAARRDAGFSQEHLAELADTDRTYPSLMERGLRRLGESLRSPRHSDSSRAS